MLNMEIALVLSVYTVVVAFAAYFGVDEKGWWRLTSHVIVVVAALVMYEYMDGL